MVNFGECRHLGGYARQPLVVNKIYGVHMSNHTIDEKAFQEAYKVAVNKAVTLAPKLMLHLSDEELDKIKQDVCRVFLETYLAVT